MLLRILVEDADPSATGRASYEVKVLRPVYAGATDADLEVYASSLPPPETVRMGLEHFVTIIDLISEPAQGFPADLDYQRLERVLSWIPVPTSIERETDASAAVRAPILYGNHVVSVLKNAGFDVYAVSSEEGEE